MKDSGKTIMLAVILSIFLFFSGLFMYGPIVQLLLPEVDKVFYLDTEVKGLLGSSFLFSLILALMPIFIVCTWGLCRVNKKGERLSIVLIVIVFAFLTVFVRQQILAAYLIRLSLSTEIDGYDYSVNHPLNRINFEWYLFAGFVQAVSLLLYCTAAEATSFFSFVSNV